MDLLDLLDARHDDANGCRAMDAWPGLQAGFHSGKGQTTKRAEPFSLVDIRGLNSRRKQSWCGFGGPTIAPADMELVAVVVVGMEEMADDGRMEAPQHSTDRHR